MRLHLKNLKLPALYGEYIINVAIVNGNLENIKWLRLIGYPFNNFTAYATIYKGNIKIMKW
jgi:hypothetical protein